MQEWLHGLATRNSAVVSTGPFLDGYDYRGVLHTTESGPFKPSTRQYGQYGHTYYPHFTYGGPGKENTWQHYALNRAARALQNRSGGVETNRIPCIQIECVGYASQMRNARTPWLEGLRELMKAIEDETGIRPVAPSAGFHDTGLLAVVNSHIRFSGSQWLRFNGWCGHQHVPENEHWDPGKINIAFLLDREDSMNAEDRKWLDGKLDAMEGRIEKRIIGVIKNQFEDADSALAQLLATQVDRHLRTEMDGVRRGLRALLEHEGVEVPGGGP